MTKWIKCSERLPERVIPVLIYVPGHKAIYAASFCDWIDICNKWHLLPQGYSAHQLDFEEVTHWMPLPEPPEDE